MRTGIGQTVCAKFSGRLPTVRWEVNVDALIGAIELLHHVPQPHDSLVTQVPVGQPQNMSNTIPYKKKRFLSCPSGLQVPPSCQPHRAIFSMLLIVLRASLLADKHSLSKYSPSKAPIRISI